MDQNRRAELRVAGFVIAILNTLNRQQVEDCASASDWAENRPEDTYATGVARRLLGEFRATKYLEDQEREGFEKRITELEERNKRLVYSGHQVYQVESAIEAIGHLVERSLPELQKLLAILKEQPPAPSSASSEEG